MVREKLSLRKILGEKNFRSTLIVAMLIAAAGSFMFSDSVRNNLTSVLVNADEAPISVYTAKSSGCSIAIPAYGEISGQESVPVSPPRTRSGPLTIAWLIPEGSFVRAGEPIVRFDSTDAMLILERQRNILAANDEELNIAREDRRAQEEQLQLDIKSATLEHTYAGSKLPEDKTIFSKWEIMEAQLDVALARERVNSLKKEQQLREQIADSDYRILMIEKDTAEYEIETAEDILNLLELVSPVSGLVTYHARRGVKPQVGDQCWYRQVLIDMVDTTKLQAQLYVLERDAGDLKKGMEVRLDLDAFPTRRFRGKIESVTPLAKSLERNSPLLYFTCDASIEISEEDLEEIRPGMKVQAEIIRDAFDSCLVVPESAVTAKDGGNFAYVQQNGKFVPRPVDIVAGPHGQTVILSGIQDGEIIALHNPYETRKLYLPDFGKAGSGNARQMPNRRPRGVRR